MAEHLKIFCFFISDIYACTPLMAMLPVYFGLDNFISFQLIAARKFKI